MPKININITDDNYKVLLDAYNEGLKRKTVSVDSKSMFNLFQSSLLTIAAELYKNGRLNSISLYDNEKCVYDKLI